MLPKSERLSVRDIGPLSRGRSVFGARMSLRYVMAPSGKISKFSVSVSKKTARRAVDRNRIKPPLNADLREVKKEIKKPAFIMVMPKEECRTIPVAQIRDELTLIFKKAGLSA